MAVVIHIVYVLLAVLLIKWLYKLTQQTSQNNTDSLSSNSWHLLERTDRPTKDVFYSLPHRFIIRNHTIESMPKRQTDYIGP